MLELSRDGGMLSIWEDGKWGLGELQDGLDLGVRPRLVRGGVPPIEGAFLGDESWDGEGLLEVGLWRGWEPRLGAGAARSTGGPHCSSRVKGCGGIAVMHWDGVRADEVARSSWARSCAAWRSSISVKDLTSPRS
jgi:hypothetical protein